MSTINRLSLDLYPCRTLLSCTSCSFLALLKFLPQDQVTQFTIEPVYYSTVVHDFRRGRRVKKSRANTTQLRNLIQFHVWICTRLLAQPKRRRERSLTRSTTRGRGKKLIIVSELSRTDEWMSEYDTSERGKKSDRRRRRAKRTKLLRNCRSRLLEVPDRRGKTYQFELHINYYFQTNWRNQPAEKFPSILLSPSAPIRLGKLSIEIHQQFAFLIIVRAPVAHT